MPRDIVNTGKVDKSWQDRYFEELGIADIAIVNQAGFKTASRVCLTITQTNYISVLAESNIRSDSPILYSQFIASLSGAHTQTFQHVFQNATTRTNLPARTGAHARRYDARRDSRHAEYAAMAKVRQFSYGELSGQGRDEWRSW
jgi:hypothetical protein